MASEYLDFTTNMTLRFLIASLDMHALGVTFEPCMLYDGCINRRPDILKLLKL